MKLEAISALLDSLGFGVEGKDIFINEMPADCKTGILLLDTYSGSEIDHYKPGYYDTGFRVAVRAVQFTTGADLALRLVKAMTIHSDTPSESITIRQMLPVNLPRPYRRSVGGFWEFEIDVDLVFLVET